MVSFPTQIPDYDSHSPALSNLFIYSDTSIYSKMAFPPLGNFDHVVYCHVLVSTDLLSNSKRDSLFHHIGYDYSCADWNSLCDHLRDILLEEIFKLSASAVSCEFCEVVEVGIDVYIFIVYIRTSLTLCT